MKIKKYLLVALVGFMAASCSDAIMDEINKDTNNPPAGAVPARLQITDAIMSSAFTTSSGSYAWYLSSFTEQEFGTGNNQLMKIETRNKIETMSSTTYNNEWNGTYGNLRNLSEIIEKCNTDGNPAKGALDLLGMAQTLTALNYGILTDLHGDISCSEAIKGQINLQPKVDKQEDIYNNVVLANLNSAIDNFKAAITGRMASVGSQDILFGNNNKKWLASAYALKARYLLHTSFRNRNVYSQVIEAANNAIANGFEGMDLSIFDGNATLNPWWSYYYSREYTGVTTTVANLFTEREDPRLAIYAFPYYYYGVAYEQICEPGDKTAASETGGLSLPAWLNYQRTAKDPGFPDGSGASIHMMSKSELYFILAEAQARLGQDASAAFGTAVEASFNDYANFGEVGDASEYLASIADEYSANPLVEIMIQKYLSQCRDEQIEAYNDIRRCKALGESYITLTNPNNIQGGANCWPERLPYGNSSVVSNPIIKELYGDGNYIFTEKIWLYGGTR